MFKRSLLATLGVAATLAAPAAAQEEAPRDRKEKKVRRLLELTGAARMATDVMDGMVAQLKRTPGMNPAFLDRLREKAKPEELVEMIVPIYMKHLDEETVDAGIRFFESPAGRRFVEAQPAILKESMAAGHAWGLELANQVLEELGNASSFQGNKVDDMNSVRMLVSALAVRSEIPMANGQVDVYAPFRDGDLKERHLPTLKSARFDYGPTQEEVASGDYRHFPYERWRGAAAPTRRVPVLWDRKPDEKDGRVVGFSDGSVGYLVEAAFRELLEKHGQRSGSITALKKCREYYDAAMTWKMIKKRTPASFEELEAPLRDGEANFLTIEKDPWGNRYVLQRAAARLRVVSPGSDGEVGTGDDIVYPYVK